MSEPRVRRSLYELQDEYVGGNKKPLDDLMRAWKAIKELPPDDGRSFFKLGGYHGEPFRGAGWGSSAYWGGYCNHGNVLFPTWHRVYLVKIEEALQSIPGCADVMMPFWDETSQESCNHGVPWSLTQKDWVLDGETIPNPLRSFVLPKDITDNINGDQPNYTKPKGYETVRYPLSGLVGTPEDADATKAHNEPFEKDYDGAVHQLNTNIVEWLTTSIVVDGVTLTGHASGNEAGKYRACLDAPNFTVFSNTSSAAQWNDDLEPGAVPVVPLESPHNAIHLAIGGYDVPGTKVVPGTNDFSPIEGANGDMGENDTAALDPIFYFHHCFVDRMFWLWQKRHGCTDHLDIINEYPGTNSVDSQGPTPGVMPNSWLTMESPLNPFTMVESTGERAYTSLDCVNIETQLGYTYGPGSLDDSVLAAPVQSSRAAKTVRVSAINRARIRGSFLVSVFANIGGERVRLGTEAVLSRWSVQGCANCQTHLEVKAFVGLHAFDESIEDSTFEVEIRTRDGMLPVAPAELVGAPSFVATAPRRSHRLDVR
jgi:tyrosinase